MSIFVQPTAPPKPKTPNTKTISLLVAALLIVFAVGQLFTFEKFADVFGGSVNARLFTALIVAGEVLALPFLLSMRLSIAMRVFSMGCGWAVALSWFVVTIWENVNSGFVMNAGLLGATVPLTVGWWSVLVSVALGILVAWASWGMWPLKHARRSK